MQWRCVLSEQLLNDPQQHSGYLAHRGATQPVHELVRDANPAKASQQNQRKRFDHRKEESCQDVERDELLKGHVFVNVDVKPGYYEGDRPKSE